MPEASEICNQTDKGGIQNLPKSFALNGSKVVYEGYVEAPTNSFYQFILYYAGYMKIYIDGKLVVPERWRTAWNPNSYKFETAIQKGKKTPIRIEWQPDGDVSYCGLRVAAPRSEAEKNQLSIWSEMSPDMDYYFIAGKNMDEVISGYRTLTGKAPVYPKWVLGFWQSRERYQSSKDIEENMKKFRDLKIPVDNIVQDWNYWKLDSWGSHEFEAARYPNPQAMLDSVHALHGRFMISVWPKFYDTVKNYKELDAKGWMYHQAIKDDIHDWLGFRGSFYDAYDAGARKMFWRQMDENLYTKYKFGIDAWWMDASEPNVRDCTPMWYRKALSGPTALGTSTEYFNAYSIVNADAIYNGQRSVNPNQRVFLLTRSGFAGEQRYSTATWSGAILPIGPEMQWSDEKKPELIDLYVYAGKDGSYTLYEDEGTNYNYEKGKYAVIDFKYDDARKQVTIGARKGSFDGMLQKRRFNIILVDQKKLQGVNLAKSPKGKVVKYSGQAMTVKLK